ncbi:hypothetical protein ACJMK2_014477, partial [Sinanodonta woodiana]
MESTLSQYLRCEVNLQEVWNLHCHSTCNVKQTSRDMEYTLSQYLQCEANLK